MAKKEETQVGKKYIVGDQSYLMKEEKVYQTGEEIFLTEQEYENVKHLVIDLEPKGE